MACTRCWWASRFSGPTTPPRLLASSWAVRERSAPVAEPRRSPVEVKICGVMRSEDARHATSVGADYIGAILSPGYSRSIEPEVAARFVEGTRARLVGVFVDAPLAQAVRASRTAGAH